MRTTIRLATLLAAAMLLWLPGVVRGQAESGQVDLRPKFEKGQQIRYKMEVTSSTAQAPPATAPTRPAPAKPTRPNDPAPQPAPDQNRSKVEIGLLLRVQSVSPDGEATVDMVFESLKVSATTQEGVIEFDSTKPPKGQDDIAGMLLQGLVGSAMTMRVDRSGNITGITGGEAFSALGQFVGGGGGGGAGGLFGPLFNVKKGNGLVRIGESWEDEDRIDNSLLGRFKMVTRHTLRSVVAREASLDMTGKIQADSEAGSGSAAQIKDSSFNGRYTWDLSQGMLRQLDSTMKIKLEQRAEGVPTTTQSETVMKVTRVR